MGKRDRYIHRQRMRERYLLVNETGCEITASIYTSNVLINKTCSDGRSAGTSQNFILSHLATHTKQMICFFCIYPLYLKSFFFLKNQRIATQRMCE